MFDRFWACYPIKQNKKKCRLRWESRNLDDIGEQIIEGLNNMLANDKLWKIGMGIPHPYTYINGDRWEDHPDIEQPKERGLPNHDSQLDGFARANNLTLARTGEMPWEYRPRLQAAWDSRQIN